MLILSQNKKFVLLQGFLNGESNTSVFYAAHLESWAMIRRYEESRLDEHITAKLSLLLLLIIIIISLFLKRGWYPLLEFKPNE